MSFEQIKETRELVRAKLAQLNKRENTDDVLELTLEELSAISGGVRMGDQEFLLADRPCCPCPDC